MCQNYPILMQCTSLFLSLWCLLLLPKKKKIEQCRLLSGLLQIYNIMQRTAKVFSQTPMKDTSWKHRILAMVLAAVSWNCNIFQERQEQAHKKCKEYFCSLFTLKIRKHFFLTAEKTCVNNLSKKKKKSEISKQMTL